MSKGRDNKSREEKKSKKVKKDKRAVSPIGYPSNVVVRPAIEAPKE
ncbi:MAG: hypothetical protein ACRENM_03400 [Candidatus Dormibacteraceae bacterium]